MQARGEENVMVFLWTLSTMFTYLLRECESEAEAERQVLLIYLFYFFIYAASSAGVLKTNVHFCALYGHE